jgi:4-hydroxy-3-methylbut-2-en-1-yl diphosphate synthase IspG/GcpE
MSDKIYTHEEMVKLCDEARLQVVHQDGVACPFCGDTDFDLRGLKHHITHHCEKYAEVVDL